MNITSSSLATFAAVQKLPPSRQYPASPAGMPGSAGSSKITISQEARDALASAQNAAVPAGQKAIEARLARIKSSDALSRSEEDRKFVLDNDQRLAEITAKDMGKLTADELDYLQKAGGFVNTMKNLSSAEKALYDELVAKGENEAAAAISSIALIREMGHTAGGANGTTYDPLETKITGENILKFFRHSIVDASGKADSQFQALTEYLQNRPVAA